MKPCANSFRGLVAIALMLVGTGASASLIGDTVTIARLINGAPIGACCGPFDVVVEAGAGDLTAVSSGNNLFVNVEANHVRIEFGPSFGSGGGIADHAIVVSGMDWVGMPAAIITGLDFATNFAGVNAGLFSFTDHSISMQIGPLSWDGGQWVDILLETTVSEPLPLALLALGLLGLARRRRAH